ncbi:MAG: type III-A CRISPR-associated protein Cas10/Csm1 [Firmicutes bacterium]|nr:type III-A CRISPR-associated protein Cas10/Csm1 [Bacillota bacterium]
MNKDKMQIILGGLLHDIGKPAYRRRGERTNHSNAGYEFLKNEAGLEDDTVLEQVKFHHKSEIEKAPPKNDSFSYITYVADNIASGADRRKTETGGGFAADAQLESVFNILNGNHDKLKYKPQTMENGINYPSTDEMKFLPEQYSKICSNIQDSLKGIQYNGEYINSLLEIMEANCSFVPSSTNLGEIADISLYDHCKITAAVGSCIYDWLTENDIADYKNELYRHSKEFYGKKAFLMYSFDMSGIQSFIYTVSSKGTLKMLRARSFYLELLCEHFIDTVLKETALSRANLIYSGGGHGYILLPNTMAAKDAVNRLHKEMNEWCIKTFKTALYMAAAYVECGANDLMNTNGGDYSAIFIELSRRLSAEKLNRYSAEDIIKMNTAPSGGERECRICRRSDMETENGVCGICAKLMDMSDDIIDKSFFAIIAGDGGLPLPFGQSVIGTDADTLTDTLMKSENYVRCYCKNEMYTGKQIATKIWVGNYHTDKEFTKLAEKSTGIERIGVIRMDVDNLGKAFVSGFDKEHVSLSRTAVFSRKLSIFFKKHINELFDKEKYKALIVYSGGDDVFLVSAWSDAVNAALTLRNAFIKFTGGTLTISAGIGIYSPKYPIEAMARESGELETASKEGGRNKITLFSSEGNDNERYTFGWEELENDVMGEKLQYLRTYFDNQSEHGKNLLYNLLNYLRNIDDKINIARYAYLLARTEPDKDASEDTKARYREFSKKMYGWAVDKTERQQLIIAIYLYVYEAREGNDDKE